MLVVRDRRRSLEEDRLQRQKASSKMRLSILSPESQKARQDVRSERKNYRQMAERMVQRSSVTVNEKQNSELVALINCLESSKEGQEGLTKVFNEAEQHKPGTGSVLREMWQVEKEEFFKDQRQNGKLEHYFWICFIRTYMYLVHQWVNLMFYFFFNNMVFSFFMSSLMF